MGIERNIELAYSGIKNAVSLAAIFTGNVWCKLLPIPIELLYKTLQWAGVIRGSDKKQLKRAIRVAIRNVTVLIFPTKRQSINTILPRIYHQLLKKKLSINDLADENFFIKVFNLDLDNDVFNIVERNTLAKVFFAELISQVKKHDNLAVSLIKANSWELYEELKANSRKIDEHDNTIKGILEAISSFSPKIITHAPAMYTQYYINMDEVDLSIRRFVREGKKVLVSGMGGIGKSHLCSYLFYKYRNDQEWERDIEAIAYLRYEGDINQTLLNCMLIERTGDSIVDLSKAWKQLEDCSVSKKLLLLIDDYRQDKSNAFPDFSGFDLISKLPCAVIITSRICEFGNYLMYKLPFLNVDACLELFRRIYFRDTPNCLFCKNEIEKLTFIIHEKIGHHTLTIDFLANASRSFGWTIEELYCEICKYNLTLKNEISINEILKGLFILTDMDSHEVSILEAFSLFPGIFIEYEKCICWMKQDSCQCDHSMKETLNKLVNNGWIVRSINTDTGSFSLSIHAITSAAISSQTGIEYKNHLNLVKILGKEMYGDDDKSMFSCISLNPFGISVVNHYGKIYSDSYSLLCHQVAYNNAVIGNFVVSIEYAKLAYNIREETHGRHDYRTYVSACQVGFVLYNLGLYHESLEIEKYALDYSISSIYCDEYDLISNYAIVAMCYVMIRDFDSARMNLDMINILIENIGTENKNKLCYNAIGEAYRELGDYKMALKYFREGLRDNSIDSLASIGSVYHNIARVYHQKRLYKRALIWYEIGLKKCIARFGEGNYYIAYMQCNIGKLYIDMGEYDIALTFLTKCTDVIFRAYGSNHPKAILVRKYIACALKNKGKIEEARKWNQEALYASNEYYGVNSPESIEIQDVLSKLESE